MFNSAKNFVSKNKGGILSAAKSMVGGGAAEFIDIGTKFAGGDIKGAAMDALDLGERMIESDTGREMISIAKTAMVNPAGAGIKVAMILGKKALPEDYWPMLDMVEEASTSPVTAGLKAAAFVAKKNLPPEAAKLVDIAAKIAENPTGETALTAAIDFGKSFLPPKPR